MMISKKMKWNGWGGDIKRVEDEVMVGKRNKNGGRLAMVSRREKGKRERGGCGGS